MAMGVASGLDLSDSVCKIAARLLIMGGVTPMYRNRAAYYLAYHGEKKHIPLLTAAMKNVTVIASVRPLAIPLPDPAPTEAYTEVQIRDVALAAAIIMAGQKPTEFGFTDRHYNPDAADKLNLSTTRYTFETDEARKKAFAKWTDWRKANVDK
jgi:hypothetical protein